MARAGAWLALATIIMTYPMGVFPWSLGPFRPPDAKESAWALSWVSHQLTTHPLQLFEANQFHPVRKTLLLSEPHLLAGLLALPLLHLSNDLVLTYNLLLLLALFGSALSMYLLVVSLTASHSAAVLAGLFFAFSPYRLGHLSPLPLQLDAFLPLALLSLHRFTTTGDRRWLGRLLVCLVAEAASVFPLAAASLLVVLAASLTLGVATQDRVHRLRRLAATTALSILIVLVLWQPYLRSGGVLPGASATTTLVTAEPTSYLSSPSWLYRALGWPRQSGSRTPALFPGITLLVLAAGGAGLLAMRGGGFPRPWATASCYALLLLGGIGLSLGPPTALLAAFRPWLGWLRGMADLSRFNVLTSLALSVFSAHCLSWLFDRRRGARALAITVGIVYAAESWVFPSDLQPLDDRSPQAYRWLAEQASAGAIVELPFHARDAGYLLGARHHGFRPSLNGASAWVPASHRLLAPLLQRFPSPESLHVLQRLNVRYVLIHAESYEPHELIHLLNAMARYRSKLLPLRDFGQQLVYELIARAGDEEHTPPTPLQPLRAQGIPPALFDSDRRIPWRAPARVTEIEVELIAPALVGGLRLHYGPNPESPAVDLDVLALDETGSWRPLRNNQSQWFALSQLILGLLEDPSDGRQTVRFSPVRTSRVRLRLHGLEGPVELNGIEVLAHPGPS